MKRSSMPSRRKSLRRGVPLRRTANRRKAARAKLPVDVRAAVAERSGGRCEIGITYFHRCLGVASEVHHRVALGMGGAHGAARSYADRLSSLLHGCTLCHAWVTGHPTEAEVNGWSLPRGSDASAEPTWYRGRLVFLDDFGGVHDYESACA